MFLELWWRGVGGGVVRFKFEVASRSESPRSRVLADQLALRQSARDRAVYRAAPATALLGPLAQFPRLSPTRT